MKLVLLRHGQSYWNLQNRFTGWKDVSLTKEGIQEAKFSGNELLKRQINFKSIYTSKLKRASSTAKIVAEILKFPKNNIIYDWRLNERHYGALEGLNKSETALKYGEKQVKIWRRSYRVPPPLLDLDDKRHPRFNKNFDYIGTALPSGESLEDVVQRLAPFWKDYTRFLQRDLGNHLIVAHSNSLRAIIKILENLSEEDIISLNIPTGVPLVYSLDNELKIKSKKYLISSRELKKKQLQIINQGKKNV